VRWSSVFERGNRFLTAGSGRGVTEVNVHKVHPTTLLATKLNAVFQFYKQRGITQDLNVLCRHGAFSAVWTACLTNFHTNEPLTVPIPDYIGFYRLRLLPEQAMFTSQLKTKGFVLLFQAGRLVYWLFQHGLVCIRVAENQERETFSIEFSDCGRFDFTDFLVDPVFRLWPGHLVAAGFSGVF
jgi:hypothetical protein